MTVTRIRFTDRQLTHWAGMGDHELVSPDGRHTVGLPYLGEVPHGDSYHHATIDARPFPLRAWGAMFSFSRCSRYLAFSAQPHPWTRASCVVDLQERRYFLMADGAEGSVILLAGDSTEDPRFQFMGTEKWLSY